jgi:hypothetical protein
VLATCWRPGGMLCTDAGGNARRLRLWPPSSAGSKPARAARVWMIRGTVPASIAMAPTPGRGIAAVAAARLGVQVRRNTAPSACVLPGRAARGSANERSVVRVE